MLKFQTQSSMGEECIILKIDDRKLSANWHDIKEQIDKQRVLLYIQSGIIRIQYFTEKTHI